MGRATRIAINAQLQPNQGIGGVESVLVGLISALAKLNDGDEEYIIIGHRDYSEWLKDFMGSNQQLVNFTGASQREYKPPPSEYLKRALGPLRPIARKIYRTFFPAPPIDVPVSDGFYESLDCDVIHFPYQEFAMCDVPFIYNPHDLQHIHYPQFFKQEQIAWRDAFFPAGCRNAHTVAVASGWIKQDVVKNFGVDPDRVQVIPWAPPTEAYPEAGDEVLRSVQDKYGIRPPFGFYPAMTWEHKNHLRLVEALAALRDKEGLTVSFVCTGALTRHYEKIEKRIGVLGLGDQVVFPGMLPKEELRAVYKLARFVFVPTLFEAASAPVFEAWQENIPVACSTVTSLPEQVRDAALLFDPKSVDAIAAALKTMATDGALLEDLAAKGARRLADFSWERTARSYRALYRKVAGRELYEEDRHLLDWDWMRNSAPGESENR